MTELGKADGFRELLQDGAAYLEKKKHSVYLCVQESSVIQKSLFSKIFILIYLCIYMPMCT